MAKNPCCFPVESTYVPTTPLRLFRPKGTVDPEFGNFTAIKLGLTSVESLMPSLASMFLANHPHVRFIITRASNAALLIWIRASLPVLRWSLSSLLETKSPIPAPRETRVPTMSMILRHTKIPFYHCSTDDSGVRKEVIAGCALTTSSSLQRVKDRTPLV